MKPENKIVTIEERLALMRKGYPIPELKLGDLTIPCRLLKASEEVALIARARSSTKIPPSHEVTREELVSVEIQKAILEAACTVENVPYAPRAFLDEFVNSELSAVYDQYVSILRKVSPHFEAMTPEEVAEMILSVKKKERVPSDFYTYQLAEIGKFFLVHVLPKANEAGI